MSRNTLRRRLVVAFVALGVLIVIGVAIAAVAAVRVYDAQRRITEDLFSAYALSGDLNQAILDQESGFRGYALTGDREFLAPYLAGRDRAEALDDRLERVERELPDLRNERMVLLERVSGWRSSYLEPGIAAIAAGEDIGEAELRAARDEFRLIRAAVENYRGQILAHRADAVDRLERGSFVLFGVIALGVVLITVSSTLSWIALRRWVTGPLARLGAEVDRVEAGELSHEVHMPDAPDEIRVLAEQIDGMRMRVLEEYAAATTAQQAAVRAQQLVEEQAEDLRRSNAELEQFAYVASHDLQEPLRKVASFCQLLERRYKGQLDDRGEQYIEFAVDGAKRMQQLINDLLAFSRVGRLTTDFVDVDLSAVLAQALGQLEVVLEEADATVTSDDLPTVKGDASLLVQVFQNLIGNAVKFRGEKPPVVRIGVRRDEEFWEFCCADNGIGIEQQYEDKIFVIFQRLHGRDAYGGTGIGLAMCKKIVEYHGGRMWLDTEVTEGATFRWTLPVAEHADVAAAGRTDRDPVRRTAR